MPLSKILDVEGLINEQQQDSLEIAIVDFINSKKIDLIILTIDDLYPYENLKEFTTGQSEKWKIGARYERGGIIVAISKKLNEINIYLSETVEQILTESECTEITVKEVIPHFDQGNYYKGILNCIGALKKKV